MMSSKNYVYDDDCHNKKPEMCEQTPQTHDHEFLGSVKLAEQGDDRHNHRFASVTTQVILIPGGGHKHAFMVNTDFLDHLHEIAGETGPAIDVGLGNKKHVHSAKGMTTCDDGHSHNFQFTTLIDSPLVPM